MAPVSALQYRFGPFELDPARFELRERGEPVHLEPQVLSLLILLAGNAERLVSKDEVIEKIWGGRFISDTAIASRIKSARRALGDDGRQQRFIRTVHGKGFRFVAQVTFDQAADGRALFADTGRAGGDTLPPVEADRRPSIAVVPFRVVGRPGPLSFLTDALADELITDLARLHWLLVIARGSSFRFRDGEVDCRAIGRALDVRYCLSGSLEERKGALLILVQLARTSDGAVIWAARFSAGVGELRQLRDEIVTNVVANLEVRIPQHEAQLARGLERGDLGPWSAYHLGVDFMYRFSRQDNARAAELFEHALSLDGTFARALAGLSFTRFQDAFMQYAANPGLAADQARSLAEQARQCDPFDPFAYLNLGRSVMLGGELVKGIELLRHSISLSPNYAHAVYSKAWAEMMQANAKDGDKDAVLALRLSPLDPLRYGMLSVRCLSAVMRGDYRSAAALGESAAQSPGAHKHVAVIAAISARLAGQHDKASHWLAWARRQDAQLSEASFLRSFPFAPSAPRELIEATLRDLRL